MPRQRSVHICRECGMTALKWAGRCAGCGEWNSLVEEPVAVDPEPVMAVGREALRRARLRGAGLAIGEASSGSPEGPVSLQDVDAGRATPFATGIGELDRVLSGGLVPGSVTLLGGEPGIGKSTLALQAVASLAERGHETLVVAAEESAEQVKRRASRLGPVARSCYVVATTDLVTALEAIGSVKPKVVVVDSIQTVSDPLLPSSPGSTTQVRDCASSLAELAKATGTAVLLVGHVTKDGSLAGPRTLEHLVDTVLTFEGDRHHALRLLVATKHRFGPTGELGVFEMEESGLVGLEDPASLLVRARVPGPGTVVVPLAEGRRPLLVELQALVTESHGSPRRIVEGLPSSRAALMLAVIERCLRLPTGNVDLFASTVGGMRVTEPGADLALALCIVSAMTGVAIPPDVVAFGEVGLTGEIRHCPRADRRLCEAKRLGFETAVVPAAAGDAPPGLRLVRVETLLEAATILDLVGSITEPSKRSPTGGLPYRSEQSARDLLSHQGVS